MVRTLPEDVLDHLLDLIMKDNLTIFSSLLTDEQFLVTMGEKYVQIQRAIPNVLFNMMVRCNASAKTIAETEGLIKALCGLLAKEGLLIEYALATVNSMMTYDPNSVSKLVSTEGGLESLCVLVKNHKDWVVRKAAVDALILIMKNCPESICKFAKIEGIIDSLCVLLGHEDNKRSLASRATAALYLMMEGDLENARTIANREGIIEALAELVAQTDNRKAAENAAGVLIEMIKCNTDCVVKIVNTDGLINNLCVLVKQTEYRCASAVAAKTLILMMENHPSSAKSIANIPGLIEALCECLKDNDKFVVWFGAIELSRMIQFHPPSAAEIASTEGLIEVLCKLMRTKAETVYPHIPTQATFILNQIVRSYPDSVKTIANMDSVIDALLAVVKRNDEISAVVNAVNSLTPLIIHNNKILLSREGAIKALCTVLLQYANTPGDRPAIGAANTATVLDIMMRERFSDNARKVASIKGVTETLFRLLTHDKPGVARKCYRGVAFNDERLSF